MAIPVSVTLDRGSLGPLDLTPLVASGSLTWSSVVPGGFASCSFTLDGDPRTLLKQVPYLAIVRLVGDAGNVLYEGQVEDLSVSISQNTASLKVSVFGLQNKLTEVSARTIWSKRDLSFQVRNPAVVIQDPAFNVLTGNFDPSDLTKSGLEFVGTGTTTTSTAATPRVNQWLWVADPGVTIQRTAFTYDKAGNANLGAVVYYSTDHTSYTNVLSSATNVTASTQNFSTPSAVEILFGLVINTADFATAITDLVKYYDIRMLGQINEDTTDGFYGGTLIQNLLTYIASFGVTNFLQPGVIEAGSDFTIDHLDASARRSCLDVLNEIASYYTREWAVWEDAMLHWRTVNLQQQQWLVGTMDCVELDLDASTVNSAKNFTVVYSDAASGREAEQTATSVDRRNPYVLTNNPKTQIISAGLPMTTTTATQFAARALSEPQAGPVPASGTLKLPGEQIVQHAQGNAKKAWEIRAGDNITITDLPLADIFTQDGRGENLFHIVSTEANTSDGTVSLSLDSYGARRIDVLLARIAAVTKLLTG